MAREQDPQMVRAVHAANPFGAPVPPPVEDTRQNADAWARARGLDPNEDLNSFQQQDRAAQWQDYLRTQRAGSDVQALMNEYARRREGVLGMDVNRNRQLGDVRQNLAGNRAAQLEMLAQLEARAGGADSAVGAQTQSMRDALAMQAAQAARVNPAVARAALAEQMRGYSNIGQQGGAARAQEMDQATGGYYGGLTGLRGQDLQRAGAEQGKFGADLGFAMSKEKAAQQLLDMALADRGARETGELNMQKYWTQGGSTFDWGNLVAGVGNLVGTGLGMAASGGGAPIKNIYGADAYVPGASGSGKYGNWGF